MQKYRSDQYEDVEYPDRVEYPLRFYYPGTQEDYDEEFGAEFQERLKYAKDVKLNFPFLDVDTIAHEFFDLGEREWMEIRRFLEDLQRWIYMQREEEFRVSLVNREGIPLVHPLFNNIVWSIDKDPLEDFDFIMPEAIARGNRKASDYFRFIGREPERLMRMILLSLPLSLKYYGDLPAHIYLTFNLDSYEKDESEWEDSEEWRQYVEIDGRQPMNLGQFLIMLHTGAQVTDEVIRGNKWHGLDYILIQNYDYMVIAPQFK